MEFPLAVGLLSLILIVGVWFPLVRGGPETPAADLVWALAIVGPPVANLLRFQRAPWGCLPLAASVLVWGGLFAFDVPPLTCALFVIVPNSLFLVGELVLGPPLRRARRARRLAELDAGTTSARAVELLRDRTPEVQAGAANALAAGAWTVVGPLLEAPLGSRLPPPGLLQALAAAAARRPEAVTPWLAERLPGATAELHQPLGELLGRHGGDAPSSPDARVGHALGLLARDATAGSAAVVGILADAELSPRQRQEALEAFDRAPGDLFLERAREALDAGGGTAELAWVFHDLGQPEDAPRVARLLAAHDYDVANAAVDALAGVLARGELGEHAAPTRAAVREALRLLRAEHPAGQNRLADGLAEALGELEADLSPPASSP